MVQKIEQVMARYGHGSDFDTHDLVSVLNRSRSNGDQESVRTILSFTGGLIPIWKHLYQ